MVIQQKMIGTHYFNTHQQLQLIHMNLQMLPVSFTKRKMWQKEDVAKYNYEAVHKLETPIARINAIHSCTTAAAAKSDDAGGLEPVVFMAKGAQVMLTSNLWQRVGLCNGARGTIDSILYPLGHKPPNLPIAIMVNFPHYMGTPFVHSKPKCIPITPMA